MNTNNTPTPRHISPVLKTVQFTLSSKGGGGKSLETRARGTYLDFRSIGWSGIDLDDRHLSFKKRHPNEVKCFKIGNSQEAKGTVMNMFRSISHDSKPVHVIDTRAQADDLLMSAIQGLNIFAQCRRENISMTWFLFPSDDAESMTNFRTLVEFGAGRVNLVIVKNPARNESKLYKGSSIEKALVDIGAKTITLPYISSPTIHGMERAEKVAGRGISFAEFACLESGHIEPIMVGEIQSFLAQMYQQYDALAETMLPTELATKIKETVAKEIKAKQSMPKDDDDFGFAVESDEGKKRRKFITEADLGFNFDD